MLKDKELALRRFVNQATRENVLPKRLLIRKIWEELRKRNGD